MSITPNESPEVFRKQIEAQFGDASLEVNHFLFWAGKAQGHTYGGNGEEAIAWYSNAMLIYDFLERREQKPFMSRIYMRLAIIGIYGYADAKSKPYLDEIITWIMENMPEDVEAIKIETVRWTQLPIERIRELRMLKMKLKIAQQLHGNNITLTDHVQVFIPLIPLLP